MFMDSNQFEKAFHHVESSAFRLQLLGTYSVESERTDYDAFLDGEPFPDRSNNDWLKTISANVAAGRKWMNIHVLPERLTCYMRYIIEWWYIYQQKSGADIRFVLAEDAEAIRRMAPRDFWLFDDKTLLWMHYDNTGAFLGAELSTDQKQITLACEIRSLAVRSSIDLRRLLALRRTGELA